MLRASQKALAQIRLSGESPFDFLEMHERNKQLCSEFTTCSGARIQVTTEEGFTCLHLTDECVDVKACPRNRCQKFQGSGDFRAERSILTVTETVGDLSCGFKSIMQIWLQQMSVKGVRKAVDQSGTTLVFLLREMVFVVTSKSLQKAAHSVRSSRALARR